MAMCCSLLLDNVVRLHVSTNCLPIMGVSVVMPESHIHEFYDLHILSLRGSACQYYVIVVAIVAHNVQFGVEIM